MNPDYYRNPTEQELKAHLEEIMKRRVEELEKNKEK